MDTDKLDKGCEYDDNIKFVIIMATYDRKNRKTQFYLERSISSILKQGYKNWDLVIVGDKYENEGELLNIIDSFKKITTNNIMYINNQIVERDHVRNKNRLWNCAGANSMNIGLEYARNKGYKYYCHLDDDDYWSENHLTCIYKIYKDFTTCVFAYTKSTYRNSFLPRENMQLYKNNRLPLSEATIHSSFSFRIDIIPFNYMTSITHGTDYPSDAQMLDDIKSFIINSKEKFCSVYNCTLTCYHEVEGESIC